MPLLISQKEYEQLQKKRKVAKAPSIRVSKKVEREFQKQINGLYRDLLFPATQRLIQMTKDGVSLIQIGDYVEQVLREAETQYTMAAYNIVDQWRGALDQQNRWKLNDALKQTLGIDTSIIFDDPVIAESIRFATRETTKLITSIPSQHLGQISQAVYDNFVGKGLPEGRSLEQQIQHIGKFTQKRARLIARDQTSKTTGTLNQVRQQQIGIEEYIWRTARDQRVVGNPSGIYPTGNKKHEDHFHREGKTFRWDSPPEDGHPGQAIQCRCNAEPIIDVKKIIKFAKIQ